MKKSTAKDKTVTTTKERINTPAGYRIITTTRTKHDRSLCDILIDLFS